MDSRLRKIKIHRWITAFAALLSLISGGFLLYQWWEKQQINTQIQAKEQELACLEQEQQNKQEKAWKEQQNWINLTTPLANNPLVKQLFHHLCQIWADRYAKSKQIDNSHLSLYFGGFYQKAPSLGTNQGEMGNCSYDEQSKLATIKLNQLYLLNKLGHECYFATPELFLVIDLTTLTETLSHELAHYIQYVKHGKSNCESSGIKDSNGEFLFPELVSEHTQFTKEIKQLIENSAEYRKFVEWWKNPEV